MRAKRLSSLSASAFHLIRHAGLLDLFAELFRLLLAVVAFAQFFLDRLQLLAQIKLALALRKLPLHLRLNLLPQLQQFHFARELLIDELQPRSRVVLFQYRLALDVAQARQRPGDEIRQAPDLGDVARRGGKFVREIRRRRDDLRKLAQHILPQRGQLRRDLRLDLGQSLDARAQERLGRGVAPDSHARDAFAEQQLAFAHAHDFVNHGDRARLVQLVRAGLIRARIDLRDHADQPVLTQRFHQRDRRRPPHAQTAAARSETIRCPAPPEWEALPTRAWLFRQLRFRRCSTSCRRFHASRVTGTPDPE